MAGVLANAEHLLHLIQALHAVSERLVGLLRRWRFDRMATAAGPATGRVTASFAAVGKHGGVGVDLCPPWPGNRRGTVEKTHHSATQLVADPPDGFTVAEGAGVAGRLLRPRR